MINEPTSAPRAERLRQRARELTRRKQEKLERRVARRAVKAERLGACDVMSPQDAIGEGTRSHDADDPSPFLDEHEHVHVKVDRTA